MILTTVAAMSADATVFAAGAVATAALTELARRYALRRELLDHPGYRRSHTRTTPRGGGIAPVLALLAGGGVLLAIDPSSQADLGICLLGLASVAGIGWLDDHRPLPAWLRLLVHLLAAWAASLALIGMPQTTLQIGWIAIATIAVAGLVNAWNFMDGIDGLAASQAGLITIALVIGAGSAGWWLDGTWRGFGWLLLAAVLGFLPFNVPRARIFLGDVGSGALGFVVACLLLRAVVAGGLAWPLAVLLPSAFLIDAGLTLGLRVARGKRWWRPHREHLYQWLVRSGRSHVQVTSAYALWTVAVAAVAIMTRESGGVGVWISAGALLSGCLSWLWLRKCIWMAKRHPPERRR
jgi:UDP-N-acetylmuramyl pentapeptide phosphotransferase/UDP-N-acetylglucosamine-1-phosphate transferase